MDRKPIPTHEKPPSYDTAGSSSGTEIILFAEAIIEVDKFNDDSTTPAILFQAATSGYTGEFYTYKKLTTINHQFHDQSRCHMHVVGLNPNLAGLNAAVLADQISRQIAGKEMESGKLGERVLVEVKRLLVIWKDEESRLRRYPLSDNGTQQHCCTNLLQLSTRQIQMVFSKMEMRGWIDRLTIVYKIK
ncbi:hypothetical protein VTL71DRAFT_8837 [Oculimacula yallundae]|uniref:Uncharacterized protein n=1 Tax=Oculimacula yallundae TaxID=86028 RepID=A0ABR4CYT7_9HELO